MKLKIKFSAAIIIAVLLICISIGLFSKLLLLESFVELEENEADKLSKGVIEIIESKKNSLHISVEDYAHWIDTYKFMAGENKNYIKDNFYYETFENLDINFILLLDSKKNIIYAEQINHETEKITDIEPIIKKEIIDHSTNKEIDEILILDNNKIILFSSVNITNGESEESNGILIMGKYLDKSEIDKISSIIKNNVSIIPLELTDMSYSRETNLIEKSNEIIKIHSIIKDLSGKEILITIESSRNLYNEGKKTITIFLIFILLLSIIFAIIFFVIQSSIYKKAISRLKELENYTEEISKGNYKIKIEDEIDEIGSLAKSFKKMTIELNQKEKELKNLNENLEKKIKERTKELYKKNIKLEKAEKIKSDFLNVMTHELKTPLTAIIAYLDILEDIEPKLNEEEKEYIQTLKRNAKQLGGIIGNILEVARIEAGKFELSLNEINVKNKVKEITKNLEIIARNKGIKIKSKIENIPEKMITDEQRFEEILNNLISNAIKFTEKGEISLEAKQDKDFIEFKIKDTGVGIPEENIKKLFHDFYQVDSSVSRKYGGTGLGLSITKKLIELQGGKIFVKSKVGEGSEFIFTLPIKQTTKKEAKKNDEKDTIRRR